MAEAQASKWTPGVLLGFFATLATAVTAPIATNLYKQREIDLAEARQKQDIRLEYFRAAIDREATPAHRQRVFRFLKIALRGEPLQEWADTELERAGAQIELVEKERDEALARANAERKERERLEKELAKQSEQPETRQEAILSKLAVARAEQTAAEAQARELQMQLTERPRLPAACSTRCKATYEACRQGCLRRQVSGLKDSCDIECSFEFRVCTDRCGG